MDRYLVISSDGHAGPRPEVYRDYLDPQYREEFDVQHKARIAMLEAALFDALSNRAMANSIPWPEFSGQKINGTLKCDAPSPERRGLLVVDPLFATWGGV